MQGPCTRPLELFCEELLSILSIYQLQNSFLDLKVIRKRALLKQQNTFIPYYQRNDTFPKRHILLQDCNFSILNEILTCQNLMTFQPCVFVHLEHKTFKKSYFALIS